MIKQHTPLEIHQFIIDDFEKTWESLLNRSKMLDQEKATRGESPGSGGGGNFLFALLGMVLLEFACRVCGKDSASLAALRKALQDRQPLYFTQVPGRWSGPDSCKFPAARNELLTMLFDLIRNGKAHQYQSALAPCQDGEIDIDITGPWSLGRGIKEHLQYTKSGRDISILVRPDQLFADVKAAIDVSAILSKASAFSGLHKRQSFKTQEFVEALEKAGHPHSMTSP